MRELTTQEKREQVEAVAEDLAELHKAIRRTTDKQEQKELHRNIAQVKAFLSRITNGENSI